MKDVSDLEVHRIVIFAEAEYSAECSLPKLNIRFIFQLLINTFTLADGYSRHVEFAENAQPQFSS